MEDKLKPLLQKEKEYRDSYNYYDCFLTCLKISDVIQNEDENTKFDIISKIFLYPNQSNYVKLSFLNTLIQTSTINNKSLKRKYYQLLIDSFAKGKDIEFQDEMEEIKRLYKKSELNDFIELDEYLAMSSSEILNRSIIPMETMNSSVTGESSLINLTYKSPALIDKNNMPNIPEQGPLEDISSDRNSDMISSNQENFPNNNIINNNNNTRYDKIKISEIKNVLKKYNPNNRLPMVIMSVSANLNSNQFLNLINENFEKNNYVNVCTLKETESNNIRVYEYHPKNCISNVFSTIFCNFKSSKSVFQVATVLKKDENNFNMGINFFLNDTYERRITIKTIKGKQKNAVETIIKFLKNYCLGVEKIQILKQSKCFLKYNLDETLKKIITNQKRKKYSQLYSSLSTDEQENNKGKLPQDDNNLIVKTNDSASKYYELYKIFSNKEYGLGRTISEFIDKFKKDYNYADKENINVDEINTKIPMMKIVNMSEESTNTLNSTFNYDDENIKDKPSFFSKASEQFILNKIYPTLYNIYNIKYKSDNELYIKNKTKINEKLTINEICEKIGIKTKLRGKEKIPFKYVIDIINKIYLEKSLKKKFEVMTQASLEIRNCILEYTNCKCELDSMDDELPIIIYIATQLNVGNLFAELYMIDDYIKCSLRDKLVQNKMVTNLLSSLLYISKEWKFDN